MEVSCHEILARFQHVRKDNVQPGSAPYSLLVSDGSAGNNSMSFGWVLSMLDGTVLAKCSTPAPGHKSSFQLEGYGMLPAARFLLHLFEYCQDTCAGPYKFITDNLGLIVRVRTSLKHTKPYPNSTLAPKWDVVNEIVTTLQKMPIEHSFQHVKGHQDDKVADSKLTLEARLNVDADTEAGEYCTNHPEPRPQVPRLLSNAAQLHIRGVTVSAHYRHQVEKATSTPHLLAYIKTKNNWDQATMDTINWAAHGRALLRMSARRTQLTKMCHEILPTATITSRYDPHLSLMCPYCKIVEEDRDHVLKCDHSTKLQWRLHFITEIRKRCESLKTREMPTTILMDGLQAWLTDTTLQPTAYPHAFRNLIQE